MLKLNIPEFDYKLTKQDSNLLIFDEIRRKNVLLTPEEWVRQHIIHFLLVDCRISKNYIAVEKLLQINNMSKRTDIVLYEKNLNPILLIECKAPDIMIEDNDEIQLQSFNYLNAIKSKYLLISNGIAFLGFDLEKRESLFTDSVYVIFMFFGLIHP